MYLENVDGYEGEGDLFTKFGIEIRDQQLLSCLRGDGKKLSIRQRNIPIGCESSLRVI